MVEEIRNTFFIMKQFLFQFFLSFIEYFAEESEKFIYSTNSTSRMNKYNNLKIFTLFYCLFIQYVGVSSANQDKICFLLMKNVSTCIGDIRVGKMRL